MNTIELKYIEIDNFKLEKGIVLDKINLSYQVFGQPIGDAPVVIVNHALTGNSNITGENGWWNDLIGKSKLINLKHYTVLAFNIPGNGFDDDPDKLIRNYKDYTVRDIAKIFWKATDLLNIDNVFVIIGGSLGGAIGWEMLVQQSERVEHFIPIATHSVASDWVISNVLVQDQILNNSDDPVADARLHAMLLYRTPESINTRFRNKTDEESNQFLVENWLIKHGQKLKNRFRLSDYKLMNHLLKTNNIYRDNPSLDFSKIKTNIHIVAVNSDYFFTAKDNFNDYERINLFKKNVFYYEIDSIHGHDAFLIEYKQLTALLKPNFKKVQTNNELSNPNQLIQNLLSI